MRLNQSSTHNSNVPVDEKLVTIGGAIVRACQDRKLTVWEKRLLCIAISKIDSREGAHFEPDEIEVTLDDFADLNIERADAARILRVAIKQLYERSIQFLEKDIKGELEEREVRWLQENAIRKDGNHVKLVFSNRVVKYLTSIKGDFASYKLRYIMMLDSMYSMRLFEMVVQWLSQGRIEIKFSDLMHGLGIPEKSVSRGLYMRDIDPAVFEINEKLNLGLSYIIKRKFGSKAIESFVFTFKDKTTFMSENTFDLPAKVKSSEIDLNKWAVKRLEKMHREGKDVVGISQGVVARDEFKKTRAKEAADIASELGKG